MKKILGAGVGQKWTSFATLTFNHIKIKLSIVDKFLLHTVYRINFSGFTFQVLPIIYTKVVHISDVRYITTIVPRGGFSTGSFLLTGV